MATFDDVRRLGEALPEVEVSTSYGTPALKVRGKTFCRLWGAREHARDGVEGTEVLVVWCELDEREALCAAHPCVLFHTPHYARSAAVLVRLADADEADLATWLLESWRRKAHAALRRALEAGGA